MNDDCDSSQTRLKHHTTGTVFFKRDQGTLVVTFFDVGQWTIGPISSRHRIGLSDPPAAGWMEWVVQNLIAEEGHFLLHAYLPQVYLLDRRWLRTHLLGRRWVRTKKEGAEQRGTYSSTTNRQSREISGSQERNTNLRTLTRPSLVWISFSSPYCSLEDSRPSH
jgi:hypothetical protein